DQVQLCLVVGRAYNIPSVALRYFNVYGTRQALANPYTGVCAIFSSRLLNIQRAVIFADRAPARDCLHVTDGLQAIAHALDTRRGSWRGEAGEREGPTQQQTPSRNARARRRAARLPQAPALPLAVRL